MLSLNCPEVVRQAGSRGDISYTVKHTEEGSLRYMLFKVLGDLTERTAGTVCEGSKVVRVIWYCLTRAECDTISEMLRGVCRSEMKVFRYHAGMERKERKQQYVYWSEDVVTSKKEVRVMFATSAFGCGIDVPQVKMVIHIRCPRSIIGFLQESGRGGREGTACQSLVMNVMEGEDDNSMETTAPVPTESEQYGVEDERDETEEGLEIWSSRDSDTKMFGSLKKWIQLDGTKKQCRRWILDEYNDGSSVKEDCQKRGLNPCDLCEHGRNVSQRAGAVQKSRAEPRIVEENGGIERMEACSDGGDDISIVPVRRSPFLKTPPSIRRRMPFT